jgi:hypothetical protein
MKVLAIHFVFIVLFLSVIYTVLDWLFPGNETMFGVVMAVMGTNYMRNAQAHTKNNEK